MVMATHFNLFPCPFCGATAEMIECDEPSNKGGNAVQCTGCLASSRVHFSDKEDGRQFAADAWNKRFYPEIAEDEIQF